MSSRLGQRSFKVSLPLEAAVYCTIFELFDVDKLPDLDWSLQVIEMAPFHRWHWSSYSSSIVAVAISSCITNEIKRDINRKSHFFSYTLYMKTPWGRTVANIFTLFFSIT